MTSLEEGETPASEDMLSGNPEELAKNPAALKEAHEQMATLDVLVCGQCHSAFHFLEEFNDHKTANNCSIKSPVRDSNESKAQVWAFLLWKCSSARDGSNISADNSWKLYQQWCRMPEAQRTAWITAGSNVQALSKFAHAKVMELKTDDQLVPVQAVQVQEVKKRGRPRKIVKEDSETQPSGEESDGIKASPAHKAVFNKTPTASAIKAKEMNDKESVRNAQERVPPEDRIARRTEREGDPADAGEYVVEKILAKRFNPRRKQYEYLLKWEGYPHEQNTWEPIENMETCKHLLEAFEKQLARQKELKALRAQQQQQHPVQVKQISTPLPQVLKQIVKKTDTPALTPTGRLQRSSKVRALDQVKAWCGAEDEPAAKKVKREASSDDDDYSDGEGKGNVDPELVKSLGLGGKGMPNIKGVIKVDPKHMPNLSTGVYIMSKSSGIMKIDSPGKLGPGLNIDQEVIRKQILAAKQKKQEEKKGTPVSSQIKKTISSGGQQVTEKTIITPSGQKIIQRTIHRPVGQSPEGKSPVTILNKKLAQGDSLLRRGGSARGRGRGGAHVATAAGNIIRIRDKTAGSIPFDFDQSDVSSETSDGVTDPFPTELGPLPSPSPERELTLCPLTGRRLARAEGEPTPPPTPSPPPTPPTPPTPPPAPQQMLMKVEMSPGGTTGMLVQGDGAQPSLPVLTDEDGTEVKVEARAVKQLLEDGVGDEGEEVSLLHAGHPPIMIRGEDGVLYQVAGENEAGQTLLVAAEGVEGVEGAEGEPGADDGVMYVTREDGQDVLAIDPAQLAHLIPGGESAALQQVAVQVEGEPGEDATQVIAQLVQADLPSPGGTRRVVLLLPDGSFTMTELDKEQYESITEASRAQE
ncbi:chromodomain-containing protein chromator isoform X2 [Choristoneura fumiferana]|uniref:chromodomain-containing protein chromator isoform X2 n=1 Tax=Choristoneura fumiferana TaxID=7141 RepID=UPI003D15EEA5